MSRMWKKKREARLLPRTEELSSKKCVDVFEIKFIQLTFSEKEFLDPKEIDGSEDTFSFFSPPLMLQTNGGG